MSQSSPAPCYTEEEKLKAIEYLLAHRRNFTATVRDLGYPTSRHVLRRWYRAYLKEHEVPAHYQGKSTYSLEEREHAVKYYIEHHISVKEAVRELGYPTQGTMYEWVKADAPDVFFARSCHNTGRLLKCSQEEMSEAVIELCQTRSPEAVAEKRGVCKMSLYKWKKRYLATGEKSALLMATTDSKQSKRFIKYLTKDRSELLEERDALARQVENLQDEVYRLQMEKDALLVAGEILKKGQGISLTKLRNREKAIAIDALKGKYRLKDLLVLFKVAKSRYFYQEQSLHAPDKYAELRGVLEDNFENSHRRYGYRRLHAELKNSGVIVSEKVIRRLMKECHLVAITPKKRRYNSYWGGDRRSYAQSP